MKSIGNSLHIGQLVKRFFKGNEKAQDKIQEQDIKSAWGCVVGEKVMGKTTKIHKKGSLLFVKIDSPAMKNELVYTKTSVIERLNTFLDEDSKIGNIFWY